MKRIIILVVAIMGPAVVLAQNDVITKLFDQYYDDPNFTKVSVSNKMFELFTHVEPGDEDEKEILDAVSKLEGLKILIADSVADSRSMYDDAVQKIGRKDYEELMTVKDAQEDVKFMIKEKNGVIDELVLVVGGHKSFFIMSLFGEINLKTISKLSKSMKVKGIEYLENLDEDKNE